MLLRFDSLADFTVTIFHTDVESISFSNKNLSRASSSRIRTKSGDEWPITEETALKIMEILEKGRQVIKI